MLETDVYGDINTPALLFLHGFLGAKEDWQPMIERLQDRFFCVAMNLMGTSDILAAITETLHTLPLHRPTLVGYSMGGRLALQLPSQHPSILLSAHFGLETPEEKALRAAEEEKWIYLLEHASIDSFLEKWYRQPLFASLQKKPELLEQILARRRKLQPPHLITLLRQTRLSQQEKVTSFHPQTLFLFGEEDWTYQQLYCRLPQQSLCHKIPGAGHAIHLENPKACAEAIEQWSITHGTR